MMRQIFAFVFLLSLLSQAAAAQALTSAGNYTAALRREAKQVFFSTTNAEVKPEFSWRIFGKVGGKVATSFEWHNTFKKPRGHV
jgi:hypothetical protein